MVEKQGGKGCKENRRAKHGNAEESHEILLDSPNFSFLVYPPSTVPGPFNISDCFLILYRLFALLELSFSVLISSSSIAPPALDLLACMDSNFPALHY
ncbi:hypothetical protein Nepgr_000007 [Nepenthes gracilis]|uniref:Uncharacterized protein n=1 Tax=Nepenthes gracilis TaxID=150966 RepID=A0AAD3P2Z9_NEPGR|nr:hypothetical protein Nepgr_000007 [Nepenthes gracilis]